MPASSIPFDASEQILGSIVDGILVLDAQKKITFANQVIADFYGMHPAEMTGRSCEELIDFDHCRSCPHADLMSGNDTFTGHNLHCQRKDLGPFCVSASPLRDASGAVTGIVELYRDMHALGAYIDEIETQNVELDYERRRLDEILSDSSDGYFTASLDRTILSADQKILDLLGLSAADVVGRPCREVFCSEKCDDDCPILWAVEHGQNVINSRDDIRSADGSLPVEKSIFLHRSAEGDIQHVIGVIRNASEIVQLRRAARRGRAFGKLVSRNRKMEDVFELIRTFGPTETSVLILGESGTGKELVAGALQESSARKRKVFLKINCSALAEGLLESELFGHVRGAFTGATRRKRGKFEAADGGTIFLDEVGDMSPALQTKVLRVIEEQEFEPVGSTETTRVNVRIIAATNKDLRQAIRDGEFREDLYYRLNAIQIHLPPLRDRTEDLPLLVERFLKDLNRTHGRDVQTISARALDLLMSYRWPGNVRELRNAIEFAYVCARGNRIERGDLPEHIRSEPREQTDELPGLNRVDDSELRDAMRRFNGHRGRVAEALGISRTTLWRRLNALRGTESR